MDSRTEHMGLSATDWRSDGGERIGQVAAMWGEGGVGLGSRRGNGGVSRVSGLRTVRDQAPRVAALPLLAVPAVPASLTMRAARKIAELKRSVLLLVEQDGALVGVLDEKTLLAAADDVEVGAAMKRLELCLTPATAVDAAHDLFLRTGAGALPVAAGAFLLGCVTRASVERAMRESPQPALQPGRGGTRQRRADPDHPARRRNAA